MVALDEKQVREEFLKRNEQISSGECKTNAKRLNHAKRRLAEFDRLIASVYDDKVLRKIPEDVCIGLLDKYQAAKLSLRNEVSVLERKESDTAKEQSNVDEFIRRLKTYMGSTGADAGDVHGADCIHHR